MVDNDVEAQDEHLKSWGMSGYKGCTWLARLGSQLCPKPSQLCTISSTKLWFYAKIRKVSRARWFTKRTRIARVAT